MVVQRRSQAFPRNVVKSENESTTNFLYLPNPRIWKATIVARLAGVDLDVRGASPKELQSWLWDFDAHPFSAVDGTEASEMSGHAGFQGKLQKTAAFPRAHPFGTVPAAFSPDGKVGIFESNSIMRAVARLGDEKLACMEKILYESSRIDSFLDASLVFARDSQIYLLALGSRSLLEDIYSRARDAFTIYMSGINDALSADREFIVGDRLTLADVCFVAEFALFHNEKPECSVIPKKRGLRPNSELVKLTSSFQMLLLISRDSRSIPRLLRTLSRTWKRSNRR